MDKKEPKYHHQKHCQGQQLKRRQFQETNTVKISIYFIFKLDQEKAGNASDF